jgi:hypothetical protein
MAATCLARAYTMPQSEATMTFAVFHSANSSYQRCSINSLGFDLGKDASFFTEPGS